MKVRVKELLEAIFLLPPKKKKKPTMKKQIGPA